MGAQGSTTVNFGAFPGSSDTSVAVTGQASILAGSLVEAWVSPVATGDHSADEHLVETFKVMAGNVVAGLRELGDKTRVENGCLPQPVSQRARARQGSARGRPGLPQTTHRT